MADVQRVEQLRIEREEVLQRIAVLAEGRVTEATVGEEPTLQGEIEALREILAEIEAKLAVAQRPN